MPEIIPDETQRETLVTLRVLWYPKYNDHPAGWDWETLLDTEADGLSFLQCKAEVVSFQDKEDDESKALQDARKEISP